MRGSHPRQNVRFHSAGLAYSCLGRGKAHCQSVPQIYNGDEGHASLLQNPLKPHSLYVLLSVTTTFCQLCRGKCSAQHWWWIRGLHNVPLPSSSLSSWWGTVRAAEAGLGFSSCMSQVPCCHTNTLFPFEKRGKK